MGSAPDQSERSPRYPIFIPSRGRADRKLCITAVLLEAAGIPFSIVVEPQEAEDYARIFGEKQILILPFRDRGLAASRNWIKQFSRERGDVRHWQLDDDVKALFAFDGKRKRKVHPGYALSQCEDFIDRYSNVAIAGIRNGAYAWSARAPISINRQVYVVVLVTNSVGCEWRGKAEDTDYSLQVLCMGLCTVLFSAFYFEGTPSMKNPGGLTDTDYAVSNRTLDQAQSLRERWPDFVKITTRYGQRRMDLAHVWKRFRTPLRKIIPDPRAQSPE